MTARTRAFHDGRAGFTLLEVMVAVAILGVALTSIFSSEAGAIRAGLRARQTDVATLLARCKMAEMEELVLTEGLPAVDARGEDACCEDAEVEGFSCEWSIDRVVLPDDGGLDEEGEAGALEGLTDGEERPSVDQLLSASGGGGSSTDLVMQLAFPLVKPIVEAQVRRATFHVTWREGMSEQGFEVTRFLVSDAPAAADQEDDEATDGTTP